MERNMKMEWSWNECLTTWGTSLRGLAQGGICYGQDGADGAARYGRLREIALELLKCDGGEEDSRIGGMIPVLLKREPSMSREEAAALARELLGLPEPVSLGEEQVRAWGAEIVALAEAGLEGDLESPFDIDRYQAIRQLGGKMRDLDL